MAILKDLIVNGASRFIGKVFINRSHIDYINDVAVTETPKFTDTTYESKAAASGGTAVSLVTTGEKYTWNNKTSNTGTVTQVTAGTGLSVGTTAGGNITGTGTLNHTNSVTAQTTQAIYPIKIDAQGHISAYGNAVTPLTASSTLDATKLSGTVPTASLPSYVDDVLEYSAKSSFPATGETGKIYVDTSTNLTWRWGGSAYVEISPSLALGTTSSTAYRGDYGNTAYIHATDSNRLTTAKASGLYKIATTAHGHVATVTAVTKSDITGLGIPGDAGVTGVKGNSESDYRTGNVNITPANVGSVALSGDTMTGKLVTPSLRAANTYYGLTFGRTTGTPVETILYTGIKWQSGVHMPVIHITGYAYGLNSPVEFKIGFYIYQDKIGYCGVTNMGAW